jgi:hypothetical protein
LSGPAHPVAAAVASLRELGRAPQENLEQLASSRARLAEKVLNRSDETGDQAAPQ